MIDPKDRGSIWKVALWSSGMIILVIITVMWYMVMEYNTTDAVVSSNDEESSVYVEVNRGSASTDSWITVIQITDDPEDIQTFTGETCTYNIVNRNKFDIQNWFVQIDITQECYLSGFWCGGFEVHQFRDGIEQINMIESQSSDVSKMNIDRNKYSDIMLIHLLPGDYLKYIPSESAKENVVEALETVGIGFIFYYQDSLDISNWTMEYNNHLRLIDVVYFRILLCAIIIWIGSCVFYFILCSLTQKMRNEMNKKIKSMSIMADLFDEAYMISIKEDYGHLIKGDENNLSLDLRGDKVSEKIKNKIESTCKDEYRRELSEFVDLNTIIERMGNCSSIKCEIFDNIQGWIAIRVFKTGEDNTNHIVLAVQDINEEKNRLHIIEERMNVAEYKQNVSGSFMGTVAYALNDISRKIEEDGGAILNGTSEDINEAAKRIVMNTKHMNLIQNTMIDLYSVEFNRLELNIQSYNVHEMVDEILQILTPFSVGKSYEFIVDVDAKIPDSLKGDVKRIEQIIVIILFSSLMMTQSGFVKFSLYGKQTGNEEELIFTIKDSGMGFDDKQLREIHEFINGSLIENFDNASLVYLKIINGILKKMGSELKIVSVAQQGSDFYFMLKQEIG